MVKNFFGVFMPHSVYRKIDKSILIGLLSYFCYCLYNFLSFFFECFFFQAPYPFNVR